MKKAQEKCLLHDAEVLCIGDLLRDNILEELHAVLLPNDGGEVVVVELLVIAIPLAKLGQVHDEHFCGLHIFIFIHFKNSFGINSNYPSLKRSHYTVRNKGDLDSFIKLRLRFWSL